MKTLTVHDPEKKPIYDILFSKDYSALPDALQSKSLVYAGRRICIVSETNVAPLYADEVVALFRQCGAEVTVFVLFFNILTEKICLWHWAAVLSAI